MKKQISFVLAFLMVCTLLPFTALAGGGGAGWYWPDSYNDADAFRDWLVLDGNNDGLTFRRLTDSSGSAYMRSAVHPDGTGSAQAADEFLISPRITLTDGQEYRLYFESRGDCKWSEPTKFAWLDVYIYAGIDPLTTANVADTLKTETAAWHLGGSTNWIQNNLDLTSYRGRTIQIVFHQNNQDAGQLELRTLRVYWAEPDEILGTVTATNCPLPQVGKTPANLKESDITFPDFANYELVPGSLTYLRTVDEALTPMQDTERFKNGEEYTVRFQVRPTTATDWPAPGSGTASVNGRHADYYHGSDSTVTVHFSVGYLNTGSDDLYIDRIDFKVPVPLAGDSFDWYEDDAGAAAVGPTAAGVQVKESKWYNEWGVSGTPLPFEAGKKYAVEIDIQSNPGYYFDEQTVVTINGQPAKTFRQTNVSTWYAYSENFTIQPKPDNPFVDVPESAYFERPVLWAVNHDPQITNGMGGGRFAPDSTCTRGQIVTFLWRAMGEPEPTSTSCPFTDVHPSDYYYKAVLWAVENNITNGTGPNTFSPDAGCTRGQVATFLWRAEGEPEPGSAKSPFTDVTGDYYFTAVLWAVEQRITNGVGNGLFAPNNTCTRGQIVTFLYRDMA